MIRRISKNNDYRDIIKSCPTGVIDDITAIYYFVSGSANTQIEATFTKKGTVLEVILPSSQLKELPNGVLIRRALYSESDPSFPDGEYNLEFVNDLGVWLGEEDTSNEPKLVTLSVSANGTYTPPTGYDGFSSVAVSVSETKPEEMLEQTITVNGSYEYTPTPGAVFSGANIVVAVSASQKQEEILSETIASNGTYEYIPSEGAVYSSAVIAVSVPTTVTVSMSQSAYDSLAVKDQNTIYLING